MIVRVVSVPKMFNYSHDAIKVNLNVQKAQIFNRYGTEVYSKLNYLKEWNGNSDGGHELPSATYYYVLTFVSGKVKTGWIYINREN